MSVGKGLLLACDELRESRLPELGVLLEDKEGRTVVKYVGKEEAIKEKEKQVQTLKEKQRIKEELKREQEELQVWDALLSRWMIDYSLSSTALP